MTGTPKIEGKKMSFIHWDSRSFSEIPLPLSVGFNSNSNYSYNDNSIVHHVEVMQLTSKALMSKIR